MMWGPSYWRFLHYFAGYSPFSREYLKKLPPLIPCSDCSGEWFDPVETDNLLQWSVTLHNKVNTKLGRYDKWTVEDCDILHKANCDNCNPQQNTVFPWPFIHMVAATGRPTALEFLQIFNNLYPCYQCRRTFFTDVPTSEESVLAWTIRHHTRLDSTFVYTIPGATDIPCASCPGGVILSSSNLGYPLEPSIDELPASMGGKMPAFIGPMPEVPEVQEVPEVPEAPDSMES